MPANVMMLGAAYQHGCLPLGATAIERAIELNGASVERNLAAFAWGRAVAADPSGALAVVAHADPPVGHGHSARAHPGVAAPASVGRLPRSVARRIEAGAPPEPLRTLLRNRAADLRAYQDVGYARRYVEDVLEVLGAERRAGAPDRVAVTNAYARSLYKLMAYKDEYEVARLHLDAVQEARRVAEFGPDAKVQVMLHPPLLRALGLERKLRLPQAAARPLFAGLRAARRVRGTALDPFGATKLRRLERALIDEHREVTRRALAHLTEANVNAVAEIAGLADLIRGYEQVKLRAVERYRIAAADQLGALGA
jgi:indolepyruvate ferredoxin oxidoreductase